MQEIQDQILKLTGMGLNNDASPYEVKWRFLR